MGKRRFTKQEDDIIKEHSAELTAKEIAELLPDDRDHMSVYQRSYKLGIKLKRSGKFVEWTKQEEQIIMDNAALGYPKLTELLPHRSAFAIKQHSRLMGIKIKRTYTYPRHKKTKTIDKTPVPPGTYSKQWSAADIATLREFFHFHLAELCLLLPKHSAQGIAEMRRQLEIYDNSDQL